MAVNRNIGKITNVMSAGLRAYELSQTGTIDDRSPWAPGDQDSPKYARTVADYHMTYSRKDYFLVGLSLFADPGRRVGP